MNIPSVLKSSHIRTIFPKRQANSHKGMNGKVLIVGGSLDYFGAPILSGLGALYGGADLVYLFVPECNFEVTRCHYSDFIVRKFPGEYLDMKGVEPIVEFAKRCDSILIGPGISDRPETKEAIMEIIQRVNLPTVLDNEAIQVLRNIKTFPLKQKIVITPHHHEFELLTGKELKITASLTAEIVLLRTLATDLKINILLKGPNDLIASEEGEIVMNSTGNAGMTVGGSGDVLSGFITNIIAQHGEPFESCQAAAYIFGKTGETLFKEKGYGFSATDLALELPYLVKEFTL